MSLRNTLRRGTHPGPSSGSDGDQRAPRSGVARGRSGVEFALWVVVVLAMIADVSLTHVGRQVGLVELNPVARQALQLSGVVGLVALKGAALAVALVLRTQLPDRYTVVVPIALAFPTVPAVISNVTVIALAVS